MESNEFFLYGRGALVFKGGKGGGKVEGEVPEREHKRAMKESIELFVDGGKL